MGKRLLLVGLATALALAFAGTARADPPGTSSSGPPTNHNSLAPFDDLTLMTSFGTIDAVVYEGNDLITVGSSTATMTGFTVPSSPFTAKSTWVVGDGQCGPDVVPEPCVDGRPTAGARDTLAFDGGAPGTFNRGPDAFRGHDDCPWAVPGGDTCLWDTRTEDVSSAMAPGDTTATATATANGDCLNYEVQVFAVGPTAAWTQGGYVADGVGLRNRGSAALTIAGVPAGSTIVKAYLYWNILNPTNPGGAMTFNGMSAPGTMFKQGGDPCWGGGASWAFRADVTSLVPGNGVYTVSGYPTGSVTGTNPWDTPSPNPKAEGASLLVFFERPAPVPTTVTLDPLTATNPVDSEHCVTATVRDQFGDPMEGVTVRFSVTGSVNTSGSATTDANGEAEFCYQGPALPGADVINAYADTDNDNTQDPGEPSAVPPATKTWVLPVTTPGCEIKITNGGWIIAMNGDRASFGGNAKADADGNVTGNEEYQDHGPAQPMNLHGNVLVIVCNSATSATIFGEATIDGSGSHIYRIDVQDNGEPGRNDRYRLRVNAYDSGDQQLRGGNVQIHQD
jgi:hypothetical protein